MYRLQAGLLNLDQSYWNDKRNLVSNEFLSRMLLAVLHINSLCARSLELLYHALQTNYTYLPK